ncbi:3-oxo-5a-steroid 4- dehydrogenase [Ptychographa xylographoides]|nr:3-oxo-5a-steroid 4- dehydrogenase [Ptychographa xylographoides]
MASQHIQLVVSPRGKPIQTLPRESEVPRNASAADLYTTLATASRTSVHRLRVTKGSDGQLVPNSKDVLLSQTGLMNGSKIYVKDLGEVSILHDMNHNAYPLHPLGPQIAWKTVFIVEYLGPLLIHPLIYLLRPYLYANPNKFSSFPEPSTLQTLSLLLFCVHFAKREYETLYIHRFSAATMPWMNIFKNSFHYWIIGGLNIAYWIYSPNAPTAQPINPLFALPGLLLFFNGELGNLYTHLVLRDLRSSGGKERGIPIGFGFDLVTCPNYLFEAMAFLGICLVTRDLAAVIFLVVSVGQMAPWAKKKERNYRNEFGDKYKKKRYSLIPGIY